MMKHTSFEQSGVLREYANIMKRDGLIKEANDKLVSFKGELGSNYKPIADLSDAASVEQLVREIVTQVPSSKRDPDFKQLVYKYTGKYIRAEREDQNTKTAEEKLYDITGETGKDLVDKAHPGGGTKTELTSKTDEGLVETIVEQQDRDIGVAHSTPKGTYAALVNLYNKLHKMGCKDHLPKLAKIIKSIATKEDIVNHALISLANELDRKGFREAADQVDNFFFKQADILGEAEKLRQIETQIAGLEMEIGKYDPSSPDLPKLKQQLDTLKKTHQAIISAPDKGVASRDVPKKNLQRDKVRRWQMAFNKAIGGFGKPIGVDGVWGPETKRAYEELVEAGGTWSKLREKYMKGIAGKEESKEYAKTVGEAVYKDKIISVAKELANSVFDRDISKGLIGRDISWLNPKGVKRQKIYTNLVSRAYWLLRNATEDIPKYTENPDAIKSPDFLEAYYDEVRGIKDRILKILGATTV